jgi:hypothetical protein
VRNESAGENVSNIIIKKAERFAADVYFYL